MASKKDSGIGIATVYRTVDALEKAGALRRRASYQLCRQKHRKHPGCLIELEDGSVMKLDDVIVKKMIEQIYLFLTALLTASTYLILL